MPVTEFEIALDSIILIIRRYSDKDLNPGKLSRAEFNTLLREELPNFVPGGRSSKDLFKELDKNKDGQLSFKEVMDFICKVVIERHKELHQDN